METRSLDQPLSAYGAVALARGKELPVRLALAVFLAGSAFFLAPSGWPVLWFAAVCFGQTLDFLIFRPLRAAPDSEPSKARLRLCMASTAANTALYSSVAGYVWVRGGEAGHVFAMVQVAGSLLHVTLGLYHVRGLLLAAAIPHAAWFLGLPFASAVVTRLDWVGAAVVFVASLLYLSHLIVAFKMSASRSADLRALNAEAVAERRRAERANAAKSDFLATVSHEIRTPLNAVIGAAHLLKRTELTPTQTEPVQMLLDGADVLLGIVNDVLDVSKIEAGKMTLESVDFDLGAKLDALTRLWEPRATEKGLVFRTEGLDTLPRRVRADPLRLQQVLFNLISNAVKFTDSGEVVLAAGALATGTGVWFEVRDTGCGMPADVLDRIFDSFEQADRGTTRKYGGTGLGLAISRRLAELMGGVLTVTSKPGEGSVFRLEAPLEAMGECSDPSEAPADEAPQTAPLRILLADDHEVNRRVVTLLLAPYGWTLTTASDGLEAVARAAAEPFDVVLMDMQMPGLNGPDAVRAIRDGGGPNARTPIVALTANALEHHRQVWAEVGAAGFVPKPVDPATLVSAVLSAVSGGPGPAVERAA